MQFSSMRLSTLFFFLQYICKGKKSLTYTNDGKVITIGFLVISIRIEYTLIYPIISLTEIYPLEIVIFHSTNIHTFLF